MSLFNKIFLRILLIILGFLVFCTSTTMGLRFVVHGLILWVPGLEIDSINGHWNDFTITQLQYKIPGLTIQANTLHLALDLGCFYHHLLRINNITMCDVNVQIKKDALDDLFSILASEKSKKNVNTLSVISYPLILHRVTLKNIQIKMDETIIKLNEFRTGLKFNKNKLLVTPTYINGLLLTLPKVAKVVEEKTIFSKIINNDSYLISDKKKSYTEKIAQIMISLYPSLSKRLNKLFLTSVLPPLRPSFKLPFNLILQEIEGHNFRLISNTSTIITYFRMQMVTCNQYAELILLDIDSPQGLLNAYGHAEFNENWPINMTLNIKLDVNPIRRKNIKLTVVGSLCDELNTNIDISGLFNVHFSIKTRLIQANPPLTLSFESPILQWPLTGSPKYQAKDTTLRLDNEEYNYRLILTGTIFGKNISPADLQIDMQGNTDSLILSRFRLATLQSNTELKAIINWKHHTINWHSELSLNKLDTIYQGSDYPAQINGKIVTRGTVFGKHWQLQITNFFLKGRIKQNSLFAKGSLSVNNSGQWKVQKLLLSFGRNTLKVQGEMKNQLALDAIIRAPMLKNLLPGLSGQIQGTIKLRGTIHIPQLLAELNAYNLHWKKWNINQLALKSNIFFKNIIYGSVRLKMHKLQHGKLLINQLTLVALGNEQHHNLKLSIQTTPFNGHLQLHGSFNNQQKYWQGSLSEPCFNVPIKKCYLKRTIAIPDQVIKTKFVIESQFLKHYYLSRYIDSSVFFKPRNLTINYFNPDIIKRRLLSNTTDNAITLDWTTTVPWTDLSLSQDKNLQVNKEIQLSHIVNNHTPPIFFKIIKLNLTLDKRLAQIDWNIKIANKSQCIGQLKIIHSKNCNDCSGYVNINDLPLSLLKKPLTISHGENINGVFNASLRLCGTVNNPQIYGQISLRQCVIESKLIPFIITDNSQLVLLFSGTHSTLKGIINTADGQVNITGHADWSCMKAWNVRINMNSKLVRIIWTSMAKMDISPDILFEATPGLFLLQGKIAIPWARIKMNNFPKSIVELSSDEIILNDNLQPILHNDKNISIPIHSNILVNIGNDVRMDAFGIKAKLNGNVKVIQNYQRTELNGHINISSGRFHAYGQNLIINKGQLLFSGPADKPYLNIEAIRDPDYIENDIIAGIRISGLAEQPKIEFFSNPVKTQQEVFSYLLRGQGLEASSSDNNMMTSILIGMGIVQSGQMMGKIGKIFGVKELALAIQGVGNSSQVVVSGYIAPGLQVKYSVGIFDSLATLTLRYRLMQKLYLKAVSGPTKTLYFLYQFDF